LTFRLFFLPHPKGTAALSGPQDHRRGQGQRRGGKMFELFLENILDSRAAQFIRHIPREQLRFGTAAAAAALIWMCWRMRRSVGNDHSKWSTELTPGVKIEVEWPARRRSSRPQHVVVIGTGIMGAAIAAELTRRGCRVTVLEQESAPAMRATRYSWAWINANSKKPRHYQNLNRIAMHVWDAMLPGMVSWCGALLLNGADPQEEPEYVCIPLPTIDKVLACEPALSRQYLEENTSSSRPVTHFPQVRLDSRLPLKELIFLCS
jgi:hypothetical protein